MSDSLLNKDAGREYLSPHEFGVMSSLSLATIRRYLRDGRLPSIQPGGPRCRVLIPGTALEAFLAAKHIEGSRKTERSPTVTKPTYIPSKPLPGPKPNWQQNR